MDSITPEIAYNLGRLKQIKGEAVFSPCEKYRYTLTRKWSEGKSCLWCMCNPSKATAEILDNTVRKCLKWSVLWGYGSMTVVNLFAWRSTDVKQIYKVKDPVGPENDAYILAEIEKASDGLIICAFGGNGLYLNRNWDLFTLADKAEAKLHYLHMNGDGTPSHPLYLPESLKPTWWDYKNAKAVDDEQSGRLGIPASIV